jgi:lipoic acid synthetase
MNSKLKLFEFHSETSQKPNPLPANPDQVEGPATGRFPKWLHRSLPDSRPILQTQEAVREGTLRTVCEEARCPNITECYSKKTATFLALGHECTRQCGFCSIAHSKTPKAPDPTEPKQIVEAISKLGLRHAVITQVARDDLEDGGAKAMAAIVQAVRKHLPQVTLELLTSDFAGNWQSLDILLECSPEVLNHNIETVRRLSPRVRHKATYERSLEFLHRAHLRKKQGTRFIKSGLMVGFSESDEEVYECLLDLHKAGVNIVTIGQYLQSSRNGLLVKRFVPPETFDMYAKWGREIGIEHMYCGPFIRSSYNASLFVEAQA